MKRFLGVLFLLSTFAAAQTIVGRISGTVTDSTGAVVPGAKITALDEATQLTRTAVTGDEGFYVVTNLPVGAYTVSAEKEGFRKAVRKDLSLVADGRVTVDFTLEPGAVAQTVEVMAQGETVNTTSGEIARVVDHQQVTELALNGRNYMQLVTLIPGAVILDENQLELTVSLSVSQAAVNGNRPNYNSLNVDGGQNLDSGSNNSPINNVGIDFIQEVNIKTSNFSAEYGRNAGAAINVVTRAGGNSFHGGLLEYFRNDVLDARNTFSPRVSALRFNDFGWNLGGPIKREKLFFFAGQEWKYIRRLTNPTLRSLPTRAERRGDFSGRTGTLNLPGTTTPVPNRNVGSLITPDGKAIAAVYDYAERVASSYVDTPTGNNAIFQNPNPFNWREDIMRLDYRWSPQHNFYYRYVHDHYDLIEPGGTFINSQIPTISSNRLRPGYSHQFVHTWLLTPSLINEAKFNTSWNGQRIPPVGDAWNRSAYGFTFPQLFKGQGRFEDSIPGVDISGFATFRGASGSLLSPVTDVAVSDNLTWNHGRHTLKTGMIVIRNRKDQNGRTDYAGMVSFSTSGNARSTGNAFADALLGNFRTYAEADDDPLGFFRFTQVEAYVTDSWKTARRLNLEMGVRYQYGQPIYTQANNIVNFDPSRYDPAQAVRVNLNGTLVPNSGNRFNGLIRAGDGVPNDELGRVPLGNSTQVLAVPAGAPRGLYEPQHLFGPRLGFAWTPFGDSRTAVRGGFGIFFDRPEGNLIFSTLNIPPFLNTVQFENGNLSNPSGGTPSALAPFDTINTIHPKLKIPYTMNWSLSVQRELPRGVFLEVAYVSNNGRHLLRQPDVNQATFEVLAANAALPSAQRASTNALRPYKGFSQIRMRLSDSTSNYNALQVYATKRKGNLTMTTTYTWSKALSDSSGNGDNLEDPFNRRFNYGPTTFDRRHIFVTTYTYRIPWKWAARAVLGGWGVSGITRAQAGQLYSPAGNTSTGTRRADYLGGPVELPSDQRTTDRWFNTAAFRTAPDTSRGNAGVGIIPGPGLYLWDFSLRKRFTLPWENMRLQFQADFFNAFNRANYRFATGTNPATVTTTDRAYGAINSAGPSRNIQFGLKLSF